VKNLKLHQRRLRAGSLAFSPLVEATAFRGGGVFTFLSRQRQLNDRPLA
jgi:hypothetical protein